MSHEKEINLEDLKKEHAKLGEKLKDWNVPDWIEVSPDCEPGIIKILKEIFPNVFPKGGSK